MGQMRQYLKYIKPRKTQVLLSVVCHILTAILTVVSTPVIIPLFQILFNRGGENPLTNTNVPQEFVEQLSVWTTKYSKSDALLYVCIILVILFFAKNLFRYLAMYFMTPVRNGILKDLRSEIFQHVQNQDISYFKEQRTGELLSLMSNDIQEVEWSVLKVIETLFKAPLVIIGSFIFMLLINVKLTLLVMLLMVFVVILIGGISRKLKQQSHQAQGLLSKLLSALEENIFSQKLIKSYQAESWSNDKFEAYNAQQFGVANKVLWRKDLSSPLSEFLGVSVVIFLMWYAAHLVFDQKLYPETFFAFILAFYQIIEPSKAFATSYFSSKKGAAAMERIQAVLDSKSEIIFPTNEKENFAFDEGIVFRNVSYKYPGRNKPTINNANLVIKKKKVTAITGVSGAGKSTLIDLLLRFVDPNEGEIKVGNSSIRELSKTQLNQLFALVDQHTSLFNSSILENIVLAEKLDINRVKLAAKQARIHDFIDSLPEAYNTQVGEKGMKLSGGQRQRIALARAIYRDAEIMIFDEATSAIDQESEKLIIEACKELFVSKTIIIIAHRGDLLALSDHIYNVSEGNIIQLK